VGRSELVLDVAKGREAGPMNHVTLLVSSPISGEEAIPTANYLCVEISRELRPIIGEPPNTEIATEERRREIDVLLFQLMILFHGN
jgi:hypothetical protein